MLTSFWDDLTAVALVGTDRRPALPPLPGALAGLIGAGEAGPAALLDVAAATTAYQRAGLRPGAVAIEPAPAFDEPDLPLCPPAAVPHLAQMLSGTYGSALPEWLARLADLGRRVDPGQLVALLDLGMVRAGLRPLILPVLGRRGRWLAGLNPAWAYARGAEAPDEAADSAALQAARLERWEIAGRAERLGLLQHLRATDPTAARALIEATWTSERAEERSVFIEALSGGLTLADEPFLEAALDDRSKNVRATAADLLAQLPGSRLARRMAERARTLLTYRPAGLLQPARIEVHLPEACDKAAQRDGVEPKPARKDLGERAWWLSEIIGRTPPSVWEAAWGVPAALIIRASLPKEWGTPVRQSWAAAAGRYLDRGWAEALIPLAGESGLNLAGLASLLPPARQEQIVIALLRADKQPLSGDHPAMAALRAIAHPWGHELAQLVIDRLRRRLSFFGGYVNDWHLRAAFEEFARHIPPDLAEELDGIWPEDTRKQPYWGATIEQSIGLLRFRRDMLAALS